MKDLLERLADGLETACAKETRALAEELAAGLPADTVLCLHGTLGAGKTTFVQGLAAGWGIHDNVTSPTFNLYHLYQGERLLCHLDAYRLENPAEAEDLLLDEILVPPWCLAVEWPENIAAHLPGDAWHLYLEGSAERPQHRHLLLRRP